MINEKIIEKINSEMSKLINDKSVLEKYNVLSASNECVVLEKVINEFALFKFVLSIEKCPLTDFAFDLIKGEYLVKYDVCMRIVNKSGHNCKEKKYSVLNVSDDYVKYKYLDNVSERCFVDNELTSKLGEIMNICFKKYTRDVYKSKENEMIDMLNNISK